MKEVEVWGELQTLLHVDEIIFHFDEINQMIEDSPTEALAYLDGLFIALSEKRSTQLAEQIGQDKTKSHLFQKNLLHLAWKHMRVGLNVSMLEEIQNMIKRLFESRKARLNSSGIDLTIDELYDYYKQ